MTENKTTITTRPATRDDLQAIAKPGETLDGVINRLITSYRSTQTRNRLAWESRIAADRANHAAVKWADNQADRLAARLTARQGVQR